MHRRAARVGHELPPVADQAARRRKEYEPRAVAARGAHLDQLGLAQAAEAVDAELVGEQVKVGERALLQLGAVQYCGHGAFSL